MPGFNIGSTTASDALTPSGLMEPLRAYRWRLESIDYWATAGDLVTVAELDVPSFEFEEQVILGMSAEYKFAKRPKFNDIEIQFYDDGKLQMVLENWMNEIWNPDEGLTGRTYKSPMSFSELDNAGKQIALFTLNEAWPKSLSHSRLSYSDNNLKRLNVKFSYQSYQYQVKN